jgi:hypothetical protein
LVVLSIGARTRELQPGLPAQLQAAATQSCRRAEASRVPDIWHVAITLAVRHVMSYAGERGVLSHHRQKAFFLSFLG